MLHFIAEVSALNAVMSECREISEHKSTIAILGFTKLSLTGNTLTLEATDLRISLRTSIDVDGRKDGEAILNTSRLAEIIKLLPPGAQIEIVPDTSSAFGAGFVLRSGRSRYRLPCLPIEQWPTFPTVEVEAPLSVPAADLKRLFGKAAPFVGNNVARLMFCGTFFTKLGDKLRTVASDDKIVAIIDTPAPADAPEFPSVIIPPVTARLILKLATGDIEMRITEHMVLFAWARTTVVSKLIEAQFPLGYERAIPKTHLTEIIVNASEARDALRRATMISDETIYAGSKAVRLDAEKDGLKMTAAGSNGEEGVEFVEGVSQAGGTWGFNARSLLTVFEAAGTDGITIRLGDTLTPALMLPDGDKDMQMIASPMALKGQ